MFPCWWVSREHSLQKVRSPQERHTTVAVDVVHFGHSRNAFLFILPAPNRAPRFMPAFWDREAPPVTASRSSLIWRAASSSGG